MTLWEEYRALKVRHDVESLFSLQNIVNFLAVCAGTSITFFLSHDVGLGAVTAAGLSGILAALIIPTYAVPFYCGAFVGMSSALVFFNHGELALAGVASGIIYVLATHTCNGIGGKLGTIAFAGALLAGMGLRRSFLSQPCPCGALAWQVVLYALIAALVTFWLSVYKKHGAVMASGIVGLVGGLVLPALYTTDCGQMLAVVVICASFTGMAAPQRIPTPWHMAVAGTITGIIFVYSAPVLGGAGGKLGTIAFGAVMIVHGYQRLIDVVRTRQSRDIILSDDA